jgi:hypothetical protein
MTYEDVTPKASLEGVYQLGPNLDFGQLRGKTAPQFKHKDLARMPLQRPNSRIKACPLHGFSRLGAYGQNPHAGSALSDSISEDFHPA